MLFADINVRDQRKRADVQTYPRACCNNTGVQTLTNVSDTDPILPQCPCAEVSLPRRHRMIPRVRSLCGQCGQCGAGRALRNLGTCLPSVLAVLAVLAVLDPC